MTLILMTRWTLLKSSMTINWKHEQMTFHHNLMMQQKNEPRKHHKRPNKKEAS